MKWVMLITIYIMEPIMFFMLRYQGRARKNIVLGVTLSYGILEAPGVIEVVRSYEKAQWIGFVLCTVAFIPALVFKSEMISLAYTLTWILLPIVMHFVIFGMHNRKLAAWKQEYRMRWDSATVDKGTECEKTTFKSPLPTWIFLVPIGLGLIPGFYTFLKGGDWPEVLVTGSFSVMPIFSLVWYRTLFKQKADFYQDEALSAKLSAIRQKYWGIMWVVLAYASAALALMVTWMNPSRNAYMIGMILYVVVISGAAVVSEIRVLHAQRRLTEGKTTSHYADEDRYWLFGMLYYNPNDKRLLKNDRVGLGQTVNIGKTAGKVAIGLSVILLLALPALSVYLIHEENSIMSIAVVDKVLEARHSRVTYRIPIDEIKEVAILERLPNIRRVAGMTTETIRKGRYATQDYGALKVNLNPNTGPFLLVRTDVDTYLIGSAIPEQVQDVYALLHSR